MSNHKLINVKLTERQNQARVLLQNKVPEWNLSEQVREMIAQACRDNGIAWPDDMNPVGNPEWLVTLAEDLEDAMDVADRNKNLIIQEYVEYNPIPGDDRMEIRHWCWPEDTAFVIERLWQDGGEFMTDVIENANIQGFKQRPRDVDWTRRDLK